MARLRELWRLFWLNLRLRHYEHQIALREARGEVYPILDQIREGWRVR